MANDGIFEEIERVFSAYDDGRENLDALKTKPPFRGIRINTLKTDGMIFDNLKKTPFCKDGRYIDGDFHPGADPYHHAGAYYVQEPSATSAVTLLSPQKGDKVLDLCAAPGGKSTQIAAALDGTGVLVSNEIFQKRAMTLVSNFERLGVFCAAVSSQSPDNLEIPFAEYFDKILVDAPCSGEGMLRKHTEIVTEWTRENVLSCKTRQLKILDSAHKMLKPGGTLVYSTCTYSAEENEEVVKEFLSAHGDISPVSVDPPFGRQAIGLKNAVRILPLDGGEGHFAAKFKKEGECEENTTPAPEAPPKIIADFLKAEGISLPACRFEKRGNKYYSTPLTELPKLPYLRVGIPIGEERKGRIIPEHALFSCPCVLTEKNLDLQPDCKEVFAFLHGEEIPCPFALSGFVRVTVNKIPLGFGKASSGRLKNYYPKGLRIL